MASESGQTNSHVKRYQALAENACAYSFFQALRLVECANRKSERVGCSRKPAEDAIRLGQEPSMAFAPSTISSFDTVGGKQKKAAALKVLFFGLFGPNGPLPLHLTEYAYERMHQYDDTAFSGFADIFHHRFLSLFYRSWGNARPEVSLDRPDEDYFARRVSSLVGIASTRNGDEFPDYAKLYFSGRLLGQVKNAEGLLAMLSVYFSVPFRLEPYIGSWLNIPKRDRMCLGVEVEKSGRLGESSTLGSKVWECQSKFRLSTNPLSMDSYKKFLPGGASLRRLIAVVRNYLGDEMDWDLQLAVKGSEIEPACLGKSGQLGWTTWLASSFSQPDFDDLYLNPSLELL